MFRPVEKNFDLVATEHEVLQFWKDTDAFEKLRAKNAGKPKWSFLDGPITANNPMGVHHAWGRTSRTAYQRYLRHDGPRAAATRTASIARGSGSRSRSRRSWSCKTKRDIENLVPGDRSPASTSSSTSARSASNKFARVQTEQSIRLGYWMDWDREEDWAKPPGERAVISRCPRRTTTRSGRS